jgi:4'-phosphopantetheinyl transferase
MAFDRVCYAVDLATGASGAPGAPDAVETSLLALLDEREVRHAEDRRLPSARRRYVVAHATLRLMLAYHLGVELDAVRYRYSCAICGSHEHGRPELDGADDEWSFSLSHSADFAVIAVAREPVGVDVEIVRPRRSLERVARRVLRDDEYGRWRTLVEPQRTRAFLQAWTAKEAYLKRLGVGITRGLRDAPSTATQTWDDWPPHYVCSVSVAGEGATFEREYAEDVLETPDDAPVPLSPTRRFAGSAAGAVVAASMRGIRDVLYGPEKEEVEIVTDWNGDKPFTDPYVLRLDPDHPQDSIVMVRPWLRDAHADAEANAGDRDDLDQGNQDDTSTRRPPRADS